MTRGKFLHHVILLVLANTQEVIYKASAVEVLVVHVMRTCVWQLVIPVNLGMLSFSTDACNRSVCF